MGGVRYFCFERWGDLSRSQGSRICMLSLLTPPRRVGTAPDLTAQ